MNKPSYSFTKIKYQIKNISPILLSAILPLFFALLWLARNTQLPTADSANYLSTTIDIYKHYTQKGILAGIWGSYFIRGWRPIFFPVVASPFLIFTKGNLLLTCAIVAFLSLLATVVYIYAFFRLSLNRLSAIVATNIIGLLPHLQVQILGFYAESFLFPCVVGSIYHLIKSDYLQNLKHSIFFAVLCIFGFLIRPIEFATHLMFVAIAFLTFAYRKKLIDTNKIIAILCMLFCALFIFTSSSFFHLFNKIFSATSKHYHFFVHLINDQNQLQMLHLLSSILLMACVGVVASLFTFSLPYLLRPYKNKAISDSIKTHSFILPTFFWIIFFSVLWYSPFALQTFQWVYDTSFGEVAKSTTRLVVDPKNFYLSELILQISAAGQWVFFSCLASCVLGFICLGKINIKEITGNKVFIYLLLITPFPIIEVFFTVQDIPRKLSVATPVLLMSALLVGLRQGRGWLFRLIFILVVLVFQFFFQYKAVFIGDLDPFLNNMVGYYLQSPVTIKPNPHVVLRNFLAKEADLHALKKIAMIVNPYTKKPVDPFLLTAMVQALGGELKAGYPFFADYSAKNIHADLHKYSAVLVADNALNMVVSAVNAKFYLDKFSKERNPNLKAMYELLYDYTSNNLSNLKLKTGNCIIIKSACFIEETHSATDCKACLFYPI